MSSLKKPKKLGHGGDDFGRGMPWLLCDLMPVGKRLVRGSPDTPSAFWTFCPLKKFPKDKIKISECEKCKHFHGYRKSFSNKVVKSLDEFGPLTRAFQRGKGIYRSGGIGGQSVQEYIQKQKERQEPKSSPLDLTIIKPRKKQKRKVTPIKELSEAIKEHERKHKEWEEEERRIFGHETYSE